MSDYNTEIMWSADNGGSSPQPPAPTGETDNGKVMAVYILMLAGVVTGITPIIAVILAYVFKDGASGMHTSHYNNAINIFWKGLLYSIICGLLMLVVVGIFLYIVAFIWFIVRCAKGLNYLSKNESYPNPGSWGF